MSRMCSWSVETLRVPRARVSSACLPSVPIRADDSIVSYCRDVGLSRCPLTIAKASVGIAHGLYWGSSLLRNAADWP